MRKFGLIGYPLSHSFSPAYFSNKFAESGISNCSYDPYPIEKIEELPHLLQQVAGLEGLNVTIPYKKQVIPYLHESTEAVKKMAACNCITIKNGYLKGFNTDVIGFEKSVQPLLTGNHNKALVLGTGGSAAAVEFVLQKLNIDFLFVSRNKTDSNDHITYHEISETILSSHKLIINTTPLGMHPAIDACPPIPYQYLTKTHYLYDLVYNPAETLFLKKGAEMGATVKNGADMLIIQAEESWKIWNSNL
jgi:shikimate dehydrogenase